MASKEPISSHPSPGERIRGFIYYAFLISFLIHFVVGPLLPRFENRHQEQEVEKVSVTKRVKVVVPTPPPPTPTPPPPTPPPQNTPPPEKNTPPPKQLKLNVPKTKSDAKASNNTEKTYVQPKTGSQEGVPQGAPSGIGTQAPATAAPATPIPATPKPSCPNPNVPAHTVNPASADIPEMARQQGLTGTVTVQVDLDSTDHVTSAKVISSSSPVFNQSAIQAAKQSQFATDIVNCAKVAGSYKFVVEFQ